MIEFLQQLINGLSLGSILDDLVCDRLSKNSHRRFLSLLIIIHDLEVCPSAWRGPVGGPLLRRTYGATRLAGPARERKGRYAPGLAQTRQAASALAAADPIALAAVATSPAASSGLAGCGTSEKIAPENPLQTPAREPSDPLLHR